MATKRELPRRFYVEAVLGAATLILTLVTLVNQEWIEAVTGADPDHGNGSLEWIMVVVLAVATIVLGALARAQWRRAATA